MSSNLEDVVCFVFDVDDTLYLEKDYVSSGFKAVGTWVKNELGLPKFHETAVRLFEAGKRNRIFDEALLLSGVAPTAATIRTMVAVYRNHRPAIELLPDAAQWLKRSGEILTKAFVTDGPKASQRAKVEALGLSKWSHDIVLTEELGPGKGKPDPAAFQLIEQRTGFRGPQCIYIADNPKKDFGGPKSLGWRTLRVRRIGALHFGVPSGSDADLEYGDLNFLVERLAPEK